MEIFFLSFLPYRPYLKRPWRPVAGRCVHVLGGPSARATCTHLDAVV